MKINLVLNENNVIISWISSPFDKKKPSIEIDDPYSIHLGFDKFVDGEIIKDEEGYHAALVRQSKYEEILMLKKNLSKTDYKLFKYLEGELSEEEYQSIKTERQEWRNRINQLEEELNGVPKSN